jgi:hypothetical protein
MKFASCVLFSLAVLWPLACPAVTINIDAEVLKTADGTPMGQSGLVILTAATTGVFPGPSGTDFTTGNEVILFSWDLSAWATDGVFSGTTGALSFSGLWDQGDALRLYWYPTLVLGTTNPAEGIEYGFYSDSSGIDGSSPWITPGESDTINLGFFTTDGGFLSGSGSNLPDAGLASLVVPRPRGMDSDGVSVPDGGNTLLLLGLGLMGFVIVSRPGGSSGSKVPVPRSF